MIFGEEAARGSNSYVYRLSLETPKSPIFPLLYYTKGNLPAVRQCLPLSAYRSYKVLPWLETRLHVNCRVHLCHSCTREIRPQVQPTYRTPERVIRSPSPSARPVVVAWGFPLTSKSTPHNGGLGRAHSSMTMVGGRDWGPGRQDSLCSHSSIREELAGRCWGQGRQEEVGSAVMQTCSPRCEENTLSQMAH
jgi:hypothetical protein